MTAGYGARRRSRPDRYAPPGNGTGIALRLLDRFEVLLPGGPVALPPLAQRVVALLALQDGPVSRSVAAATLWPEGSESRAGANLRSALWRVAQAGVPLVDDGGDRTLRLSPALDVDLRMARDKARALLCRASGDPPLDSASSDQLGPAGRDRAELTRDLLLEDVLPSWDEEWLRQRREEFRQLRLHALEALCDRLSSMGLHCEALEAGMAAVVADPLRESAHRAVMRAHLAEGNAAEAVRQYRAYSRIAREEFGVHPSPAMETLLASARAGPHAAGRRPATTPLPPLPLLRAIGDDVVTPG